MSSAFGYESIAIGEASVAIGYRANASGVRSVAIGLSQDFHPGINGGTLGISGGNVNITTAGKGITFHSPNGGAWCVTVADTTGAVTSTSGTCI